MQQEFVKDSHCSYCGTTFPAGIVWPCRCPHCRHITYRNPLPVSVVLLPIDDGLLLVRRANDPQAGNLALPGGYIEVGETWQAAGAREVHEETGFTVEAASICLFDALSAPDGTLLVFGLVPPQASQDLPPFVPSSETSEMTVARATGIGVLDPYGGRRSLLEGNIRKWQNRRSMRKAWSPPVRIAAGGTASRMRGSARQAPVVSVRPT